jgi:ubiquinone/menaquinone biosynthesis C-methylase UbiE
LESPLWEHVLVPLARRKIVETAKANGIAWEECKSWLKSQEGPWNSNTADSSNNTTTTSMMISKNETLMNRMIPDYYKNAPYHAYYPHGNLCWEAALEVEIASKAVGARNFPAFGRNGEDAFRDSFGVALDEITRVLPSSSSSSSSSSSASSSSSRGISSRDNDDDDNPKKKNEEFIMVDLGCGTGMSTRWLARRYPQATKILGMDLSPYFLEVGKRLLELAPRQRQDDNHDVIQHQLADDDEQRGTWVSTIQRDDRIEYVWGNAAHTGLPENYCNVVNLQFVAHELPVSVTCDIIREAHRILKAAPSGDNDDSDTVRNGGGQLWFCEMDFESPGYAAQRANPLLFSLIRSTEPYLDEYANHAAEIRQCLQETFDDVVITAATGRHFAICATKKKKKKTQNLAQAPEESRTEGTLRDLRFDQHGDYRVEDTHLKVWENKG